MDEVTKEKLELHVAGATVSHAGPYSSLEVPVVMSNPDQEFIEKWINPFYLTNINNRFEEGRIQRLGEANNGDKKGRKYSRPQQKSP